MYAQDEESIRLHNTGAAGDRPPVTRKTGQFTNAVAAQAGTGFERRAARIEPLLRAGRALRRPVASLLLSIAVAATAGTALARPPIACGSIYAIEAGDTLFKVAKRAYADGHRYETIYKANDDLLPSPGSVEIGDQILIPCLDGSGPATRREAIAEGLLVATDKPATTPATEEPALAEDRSEPPVLQQTAAELVKAIAGSGPAMVSSALIGTSAFGMAGGADRSAVRTPQGFGPSDAGLSLLTGSGLAPYADEALSDGGMIPSLARAAIEMAAPGQAVRIGFVDDWSSHLDLLLHYGAFDLSFPWYRPDCSRPDRLGSEAWMLCAEFAFSDAFVEVPLGYYARAGASVLAATGHADLLGQRLCRPKGPFPFDLEENGLRAPAVSLIVADTARECLALLVQSEVDAVALLSAEAEQQIGALGVAEDVAEIENLKSRATLHAVISKSNPDASSRLALLNRGLAAVMASGRWFETVAFHQGLQRVRSN